MWNTRPFLKNRAEFLYNMWERYGDVSRFRLGPFYVHFVNDPELVQQVLVSKAASFRKTFATRLAGKMLGRGLLVNEGDHHKRQRRLISPSFSRQRIATYAGEMGAAVEEFRDEWTDGRQVDMMTEMMRITLIIAGRTLFNVDSKEDARHITEAMEVFLTLVDRLVNPFMAVLNNMPTESNRRVRRARENLDALIYRLINERRASGEDRGDLLSAMLAAQDDDGDGTGMPDEQIRDEMVTLFIAGHETTANVLTWTWGLLAQHPEVMERLCDEVDTTLNGRIPTAEDMPNLEYTRRVVAESMRLYPPGYLIDREATEDVVIGDRVVPKDGIVFTSPFVMHRHPNFWDDPHTFNPDRWAPEVAEKRPRLTYFPFGAGPRMCIGERFAWTETAIIIPAILQRWRPELAPGHVPEMGPILTLRPKGGMPMIIRRRDA